MNDITGLAAVVMLLGMPTAVLAMYTFYRVRKLRTEERLAAIQRGVAVPMEPDLSEAARSRRSGILLVAGAVGYMITFTLIARVEPDAWMAASFGAIPLTLGFRLFPRFDADPPGRPRVIRSKDPRHSERVDAEQYARVLCDRVCL